MEENRGRCGWIIQPFAQGVGPREWGGARDETGSSRHRRARVGAREIPSTVYRECVYICRLRIDMSTAYRRVPINSTPLLFYAAHTRLLSRIPSRHTDTNPISIATPNVTESAPYSTHDMPSIRHAVHTTWRTTYDMANYIRPGLPRNLLHRLELISRQGHPSHRRTPRTTDAVSPPPKTTSLDVRLES